MWASPMVPEMVGATDTSKVALKVAVKEHVWVD
jgi:hypothetical protein